MVGSQHSTQWNFPTEHISWALEAPLLQYSMRRQGPYQGYSAKSKRISMPNVCQEEQICVSSANIGSFEAKL